MQPVRKHFPPVYSVINLKNKEDATENSLYFLHHQQLQLSFMAFSSRGGGGSEGVQSGHNPTIEPEHAGRITPGIGEGPPDPAQ